MMHFEGQRRVELPIETVWSKLRDAQFVADSIPDGSVEGSATRDRAVCTVQPGLTFLRGVLEVTLEVVGAEEPSSIAFRVSSKGVGSSSVVAAGLRLKSEAAGTDIAWRADVESLGGLLKMVPSGLVRGAALKVIDDVWNALAARLSV